MKVWQIGISGLMLALLVGCSSIGLGDKRIDYRSGAAQAPTLEMPPDLSAPGKDDHYRVPNGEGVSTYSDYSKGGATSSPKALAVLPQAKGVSLARNGTQRWLLVNDKPENVWPVVKAFLQEGGLSIKSEDQSAGLLETDWAENRARIPQEGLRGYIGKVFDNLYSSGERDQYRLRLERGRDGISTEVYITHKGMEEVLSADKNTSKWQARANDPEMEAIMLQRLMARFSGVESQAAEALPEAQIAAGATATLQEISDGSKVIVLHDAFDHSWRRIGLAIERAGLSVEDKDRAKGIYFLKAVKAENGWLDKLQFWKDSSDSARYRVNVRENGAVCEVSATDQNGASDSKSKLMIEALYNSIHQGEAPVASARAGLLAAPAAAAPTIGSAPVIASTPSATASATLPAPRPATSIYPSGPAGTASLQVVFDGSSVIVANDPFDKSWQRIAQAIERAGLTVDRIDTAASAYWLLPPKAENSVLDKLKFWKDSENSSTRYRVNVKNGGKACEVSVTDQDGASDEISRQLIETLYKRINP